MSKTSVYIVSECYPYEGCTVAAVFTTKKEAQAYVKEHASGEHYGPFYEVEHWRVP